MNSRPATASVLPRLATLDNLRDVAGEGAGYPAAEGSLRRGVLYRSNRIEVSPQDLTVLEGLGLEAIHDLREEHEIAAHPNTPVAGAAWHHHPVPGIPQEEVAALSDADETYAAMLENYRTFVSDPRCRRGFADLLSAIASIEGPQLFHCSAGKDRTGWATILIHHIAGVEPGATIVDYLLTDEYAVNSRKATLDSILENVGPGRAPAYEPAFRCDTRYLDTALAEVEKLYGDMDGYLEIGLGLTDRELRILRSRLVRAQ
ncbi:tyrosine-protein phosphatase [Nocardia sp. AB354]|uniref:tyrosine-protein phosphatase n=1 Tax=Nocardia sp. AB354 TaxID=3413283 RepID=UPI003C1D11CF